MIVYQFSYSTTGGAGGAARRLHEALADSEIRSRIYCHRFTNNFVDPSFRKFGPVSPEFTFAKRMGDRLNGKYYFRKNYEKKLDYYLHNRQEGYEKFSYAKLPYETPPQWEGEQPDIIHLHWISDLIDFPSFFAQIPDKMPIVWTLHDMNPFTGGCHYSWDCTNYRSECGNCPQLNDKRSPDDLSHLNWRMKWDCIQNKNLHIVTVSHWMEQLARESRLLANAKTFQTIHNGVDLKSFAPKDKEMCRRALSIGPESFVIACGAESLQNRRKGMKEFNEALDRLNGLPVVALVFGDGNIPSKPASNTLKLLGSIQSPELLSVVYSAADVYVMPSLYENLGQTAMEALACGTPVIAFRIGGNSDIVHPTTGLLADPVTPEQLAEKIRWMYCHPVERLQMGQDGRKWIEENFSLERQAQNYITLYRNVLAS